MNWGKGLVVGLGLFMSFVIFLVVMMFRSPDDSFDKDYYEKGLAYDQDYNQKKQAITDGAIPLVEILDKSIHIQFKDIDSGRVQFLRPSDHLLDQSLKIQNKEVQIPAQQFSKGEWKLIVSWSYQSKKYLYEKNIFIR